MTMKKVKAQSSPGPRLSWSELRAVAVRASADPRTVQRVLRGEPVRHLPRSRIEVALAEMGFTDLGKTGTG